MMLGDKRGKFRVGWSVNKKVRQTIRARLNGSLCVLKRSDMYHSELAALMCCCDHRSHGFLTDGRYGEPVGLAVVVNDLDVVGTLGNARVDERLRLVRRRDGRYGHAVFGAVAVRRGDQ